MRKFLIVSAILLFTISSCKKDSTSTNSSLPTGTLKATINGTSYTFNSSVQASIGAGNVMFISGYGGPGYLEVDFSSLGNFTAGTIYSDTSKIGNNITMFDVQTGPTLDTEYYGLGGAYLESLKITSFADSIIQGTFSGVIYSNMSYNTYDTITNGAFNLKLSQ